MMNALRITIFTLIVMAAGLLTSNDAEALLETHQCTFCHSLHSSTSTSSFVPQNSPTNVEVLCLGCHLTANGATAAVQPHRTGGSYAEFYLTCTNCHNIHDNMPNWRVGHSDAADGNDGSPPPAGWVEGTNAKMIGREDPDGTTPYAMIQTREADFNKDGVPDRDDGATTQSCNPAVLNDCYVQGKRHVIFENIDGSAAGASIHGFADNNEDGVDDTTAIGVATDAGGVPVSYSEYDSVCQMCHSQTNNHNIASGGGMTHNSSRRCTDCHEHGFCFDRGNSCSKWTVPNRDLQVDLASAAPASVINGETVTITVDVTNLSDNVENIEVRYISDIEGTLGRSTAIDVAASGSAQTSLDWVTTTAGTHTVTAKIVPVIGELVITNNSGTDIVTVGAADSHDVAVTLVTAPSPILQGNTETVSVDISNPGTFTETFNVVLYDNTDDAGHGSPIGTLSSGAMAPSGTNTLNFSWNTTGASLGTHTLEAVADTVASETNTGNNTATTTATVAIHDVAVTSVTAPPSVDQGTTATVDVNISNLSSSGGFGETFNVTLYDDTESTIIGTQSSGALAAQGSTTLSYSWVTTGYSIATHTLRAVADTVTGETITANNTATTTSDVIVPVTHDVGVVQIQTVGNVEQGTTKMVNIDVWNYGGAAESFNVSLSSSQDGAIDSPQSVVALAIGTGTTVSFSWVTNGSTTVGAHTLTATTSLGTDSNAGNNTATTGATILEHDVEVTLVTDTPDPVIVGGTVSVGVTVTNIGDYVETFDVSLFDTTDSAAIGTAQSSGALAANGGSTVVNFSWDTTGATTVTHTLTATAATVTNEFISANNTGTTTTQVDPAGPINDVAITAMSINPSSPIATCGTRLRDIPITVTVTNEGTVTETNLQVSLSSDVDGTLTPQTIGSLGSGASTDVVFLWSFGRNDTCGLRTFTSTVSTVPGETDTADNTATLDVDIVN